MPSGDVLRHSPNLCDLGKAPSDELPSVDDSLPSPSLVPLCTASSESSDTCVVAVTATGGPFCVSVSWLGDNTAAALDEIRDC